MEAYTESAQPRKFKAPKAPKTEPEVVAIELELGKKLAEIGDLELARAREHAQIEETRGKEIERLQSQAVVLANALFGYAKINYALLTRHGKVKTVTTPGGSFRWYATRVGLRITGSIEGLVAELKRRGLKQFIRVIESLDKNAMRAQQDAVEAEKLPGISFGKREIFAITPNGSPSRIVRDVHEDSWKIEPLEKKKK
jgi:phage host-nuclease inhibitor protein Gam